MKTHTKFKPLGQKTAESKETLTKWSEGISQQKNLHTEGLNVKFIPLTSIIFNPENSRKIRITHEEIINGPKIEKTTFEDEASENTFIKKIETFFQDSPNKEEKVAEYISLSLLAASIKSPTELINPVTVYLEDMYFHLIAGHRRTYAHFILGASEIAAKIIDQKPDSLEQNLLQWKENKDREDLRLSDELDNILQVVTAWEKGMGQKISIRKLMSILNIKKTKASWYLATLKEISKNPLFEKALENECISSLELCYNISTMEDEKSKRELLTDLLAGTKLGYKQTMARIKNPDLAVRSPDTTERKKHLGLVLNKKTNVDVLSKIIRLIIRNPEFKAHQHEFEKINITSKPGIMSAWEKINDLLDSKES